MSNEMGLFEVMYNCRAMRRLKPDAVPEELLVKLIDAASQAPSGSNTQMGRWIVIRDAAQKAKLAELNMKTFKAYTGPDGGRPASLSHTTDEKRARVLEAVTWQAEHFAETPALIIACLQLGGPVRESFAMGVGAGGSIWPGIQNLLLAARALGLGATPTTFALADRAAAKAVLGLPDDIEPFCVIPVGYPMGKFGPVSRRPLGDILRWDRWS